MDEGVIQFQCNGICDGEKIMITPFDFFGVPFTEIKTKDETFIIPVMQFE